MNNTFLERIGIDPIILFIIAFILIGVLFYKNRRTTVRYNQLKNLVRHMNKVLRAQGVPVGAMKDNMGESEGEMSSRRAQELLQEVRELRSSFADTYQKTGLVKYDAFDEMGGKLSFVLVMLDGRDNGVMLNVMHSRDDCYTYIKEITRGSSYVELSTEEQMALEKAMHQDQYYEEDRDGIPTGHTGNLKRAYTQALRKQQAAQREANRRMAAKKEAEARAAAAEEAAAKAKAQEEERQKAQLTLNEEALEEDDF